jgi:hypothetical protein
MHWSHAVKHVTKLREAKESIMPFFAVFLDQYFQVLLCFYIVSGFLVSKIGYWGLLPLIGAFFLCIKAIAEFSVQNKKRHFFAVISILVLVASDIYSTFFYLGEVENIHFLLDYEVNPFIRGMAIGNIDLTMIISISAVVNFLLLYSMYVVVMSVALQEKPSIPKIHEYNSFFRVYRRRLSFHELLGVFSLQRELPVIGFDQASIHIARFEIGINRWCYFSLISYFIIVVISNILIKYFAFAKMATVASVVSLIPLLLIVLNKPICLCFLRLYARRK